MPCSGCLGDVGSELLVDEGEGLVLVLLERGGCMCTELRWSRTRRGMWSVCARVSACYGHAHTNLPLVVRAMNRDRSGHALQHCGQGRTGQLAAVLVLRWGARSAAALAHARTRPLARLKSLEAVEHQRAERLAERDAGHPEHRVPAAREIVRGAQRAGVAHSGAEAADALQERACTPSCVYACVRAHCRRMRRA